MDSGFGELLAHNNTGEGELLRGISRLGGPMLVVTTDDIPGYRVRRVLGEVIGVTGRTRNPFQEGVRKLHGGSAEVVKALTRWRLDAVDEMIEQARQVGANAIVGMRFDHRNVTDMWGEICAYGTAVYVEQLAPSGGSASSATPAGSAEPATPV